MVLLTRYWLFGDPHQEPCTSQRIDISETRLDVFLHPGSNWNISCSIPAGSSFASGTPHLQITILKTSVGVVSRQLRLHCSSFILHARLVVPHCSFLKANQYITSGGCILLRFLWWANFYSFYNFLCHSVVWFMSGSHVLRWCPYGLEYLEYYQPPAIRSSRSCLHRRVLLGLDIWNDLSAYGKNGPVFEEQGAYQSTLGQSRRR